MRRGYMGHLTGIANDVVQSMEKGPAQDQLTQLINGKALYVWLLILLINIIVYY